MYAKSPQSAALAKMLCDKSARTGYIDGALASAVPVLFASVAGSVGRPCLFVLNDAEEAGYFYHDLTQMLWQRQRAVLPLVVPPAGRSTASETRPARYCAPRCWEDCLGEVKNEE